jgi:hypothetical protein
LTNLPNVVQKLCRVLVGSSDIDDNIDVMLSDGVEISLWLSNRVGANNGNDFSCGERLSFGFVASYTVDSVLAAADKHVGESLAKIACGTENEDLGHFESEGFDAKKLRSWSELVMFIELSADGKRLGSLSVNDDDELTCSGVLLILDSKTTRSIHWVGNIYNVLDKIQ